MRARLYALATFAPLVFAVVSLAMAMVAVADPCPSQSTGGC